MENRIRQALADRFDADTASTASLTNLGGHASLRIYWRVELPKGEYPRGECTLMAMVMPLGEDALKSDEGGSSADEAPTELPFVAVQRYLDSLGIPVPVIEHIDMSIGVLLLEDLGNVMFENAYLNTPDRAEQLYQEALDLLIGFQVATSGSTDRDCLCWGKSFDQELLRWELDHYREWGLDEHYGTQALDPKRDALNAIFDRIVEGLLEHPQTLVLRDYQSRNIMQKDHRWVMIDFQDALQGSFIYDVVALLRDSYIELEPELVDRLVVYYAEQGKAAGLSWCDDVEAVRTAFHLQTLQRKLKDAGRFVFIDKVKGNPSFLSYYEPSLGYVKNAVKALGPEFAELDQILTAVEPAW